MVPFAPDISLSSMNFTVHNQIVEMENHPSTFTKKISIIYSIDKVCEKIYIFGVIKMNSGDANELVQ
jgi:hypothetical protein